MKESIYKHICDIGLSAGSGKEPPPDQPYIFVMIGHIGGIAVD
jgi:hypothetical protein